MSQLPSNMKALALEAPGRLSLVERKVPAPAADEVLLRTAVTTICTSDLADIRSNPWGLTLPRVLGHESSGVVAAVGADVEDFKLGDRVAAHPVIPCTQCVECQRGMGHLCLNLGHLGVDREGSFAEYFAIPARRVRRVPDDLDMAQAALVEPVAVCYEAVKRAEVRRDDRVLIAGDGPFGIIMARIVEQIGGRAIIAGMQDYRLAMATSATPLRVDRVENPAEKILKMTDGVGVDSAILAVDAQAALDLCIATLRSRGKLAVFAVMPSQPKVDMLRILCKELELRGAVNDEDLLDESLDMIVNDALRLDEIVTHRIAFKDWQEAFRIATDEGERKMKVAVVFED